MIRADPGTWAWLKEWTGYTVTVLPYISSALVLIPGLGVEVKLAILAAFATFVLTIRVLHEKAGIELEGAPERHKRPGEPR